jgi:hypothetical protein
MNEISYLVLKLLNEPPFENVFLTYLTPLFLFIIHLNDYRKQSDFYSRVSLKFLICKKMPLM